MFKFIKNIFFSKSQKTQRVENAIEETRDTQSGDKTIEEIRLNAEKEFPINCVQDRNELISVSGLILGEAQRVWISPIPRFTVNIGVETTKDQIQSFFETVPHAFEVMFFDHFHPQITDPGADVIVQHYEDGFLYHLSNYHWENEWKEISKDELVEYLFKNREYNSEMVIYRIRKAAQKGKCPSSY